MTELFDGLCGQVVRHDLSETFDSSVNIRRISHSVLVIVRESALSHAYCVSLLDEASVDALCVAVANGEILNGSSWLINVDFLDHARISLEREVRCEIVHQVQLCLQDRFKFVLKYKIAVKCTHFFLLIQLVV